MAVIIPNVTNWSVTPQNGQEDYFTKMNVWLSESTSVISSLSTAITKINESNSESNDNLEEVLTARDQTVTARNEAVTAVATLSDGAIDNTNIAPNKAFSNQYIKNNYYNKTETYNKTEVDGKININGFTDKITPIDIDHIGIQETGGLFKKLSWANLKATLKEYFDTLYSDKTALSISNLLHIQDQKPAGTNGGNSTTGTNTRVLNTILINNIVGASLSSNQITLPAGGYFIEATAPTYRAGTNKIALYNITSSSYLLWGTSNQSTYIAGADSVSILNGKFTLSATNTLSLRHLTELSATNGLGTITASLGDYEVFTEVKIWKVG